MRECKRGLQRMADNILQKSVALQTFIVDRLASGLRMDKNQGLQFLGLRPERMKSGCGQILAIHAAADRESAHSELLHAVFHLFGSQRRMLQSHASKSRETLWVRRTQLRNFLVLNLDDVP